MLGTEYGSEEAAVYFSLCTFRSTVTDVPAAPSTCRKGRCEVSLCTFRSTATDVAAPNRGTEYASNGVYCTSPLRVSLERPLCSSTKMWLSRRVRKGRCVLSFGAFRSTATDAPAQNCGTEYVSEGGAAYFFFCRCRLTTTDGPALAGGTKYRPESALHTFPYARFARQPPMLQHNIGTQNMCQKGRA